MQLALVYQHTKETDSKSYEITFSSIGDDYIVSLQDHSLVVNNGLGKSDGRLNMDAQC
jgi:hypothetical protein